MALGTAGLEARKILYRSTQMPVTRKEASKSEESPGQFPEKSNCSLERRLCAIHIAFHQAWVSSDSPCGPCGTVKPRKSHCLIFCGALLSLNRSESALIAHPPSAEELEQRQSKRKLVRQELVLALSLRGLLEFLHAVRVWLAGCHKPPAAVSKQDLSRR
jgi:hypothetical protein